jgi:hypothetical protein
MNQPDGRPALRAPSMLFESGQRPGVTSSGTKPKAAASMPTDAWISVSNPKDDR